MEVNNTFENGQVSDLSKLIQNKSSLLRAVNFRPLTELGQSNGGLVNIKGNKCEIGFPTLRSVYKFKINTSDTGTSQFTITVNGATTSTIYVNSATSTEDIYDLLKDLENCYESTNVAPLPNPSFAVAYDSEYIVIYQMPEYKGCSPFTPALSVLISTITLEEENYFVFLLANGNNSNNPPIPQPYVAQTTSDLTIIGSTYIGEYYYLFTCPVNNPLGISQIWEMWYDENLKETNIKLLYNGYLDFSIDTPIPPSAALGRYEIPTIQRIYWTDYTNPVRSVNVKNSNLMVLTKELINLQPIVQFNVPIVNNMSDTGCINALDSGTNLQCAYRLVKNNGAVSNYSNLSNIVYVVGQSISKERDETYFNALRGIITSGTVYKTYDFTVSNVDTSFDLIEFVIIKRDPNNGVYSIFKFDEKIIGGNDTITTTFTNNLEEMEELTLEEFLLDTIAFTTCKTIETKDNRLFFGNVKNSLSKTLDNFDTRAFRFAPNSTTIGLKVSESDTVASTFTINNLNDPTEYEQIEETKDNIPLFNLGFETGDDPLYTNNYRYLPNSTELGGQGPYVKFKFGTTLLRTDRMPNHPQLANNYNGMTGASNNYNSGTNRDTPGVTESDQGYTSGYRRAGYTNSIYSYVYNTNPTDLDTEYQTYNHYNTSQTMGHEAFGGLFKSYMHNEIYRFGIVFKGKYGESYFTKWIADIKFPNYSDVNSNGGNTFATYPNGVTNFASMYHDPATSSAFSNIPYIEFEVTIPDEIAEVISGWEIVRVKREEKDRVVSGHGLINQCTMEPAGSGNSQYYGYLPIPYVGFTGGTTRMDPGTWFGGPNIMFEANPLMMSFHCYNYLTNPSLNLYDTGDRLYVTEVYQYTASAAALPSGTYPGDNNLYYIDKFYQLMGFGFAKYELQDMKHVAMGGEVTVATGGNASSVYHNYDIDTSNWPNFNTNASHSLGSPAAIAGIRNTTPIDWTNLPASGNYGVWSGGTSVVNAGTKAFALHIKPSRLRNQYGGRGYLKRAGNEYISAQAYQTVEGGGTKSAKVFGGDIYHGILDIQRAVKNWEQTDRPDTVDNVKCSQTWFFPTQSIQNVDLRDGHHVNADLNNDSGTQASAYEEYRNSECFNFENELKKYYPKPIFFNDNNIWNNRVYYSAVKINGENSDAWTNIGPNDYYDVEGNFGGITALQKLNDNIYYVQESAFGVLLINPVSLVSDNNNIPIVLGTGSIIQKHNNITINAGSKHQWSVARSQNTLVFADIRTKKLYAYNGSSLEPISDTKGNRNYFIKKFDPINIVTNDNPIKNKGILSTYDYYHDEFLITTLDYHQESQGEDDLEVKDFDTIAYSGLTSRFTGNYSFAPNIYINNNSKLYSQNTNVADNIYLHNVGEYGNFYGTLYKSSIKAIVNENPLKTKIFDNLSWITESIDDRKIRLDDYVSYNVLNADDNVKNLEDTFKRLRCYNEYQNTDWIDLTLGNPITNLRKSEQGFNTYIPRNRVNYDTFNINTYSIFNSSVLTKDTFGERIRDKYMIVDLEYDNETNNRFITHNLLTSYKISDR